MNRSSGVLNELIEIARDGEQFYLDAATKAREPRIQEVFNDMARVRRALINDLSIHVSARGDEPSRDRTVLGTSRKLYAEILATVTEDRDAVYIDQLEQMEDRLLQHYEDALKDPPSPAVADILQRHLLTVRAT